MEHNDPLQKKFIEKGEEAQQNKHDKPGGWAYAVITAAFSINFISELNINLFVIWMWITLIAANIASGILYSIGIMYVSLMNEFNESKGYTSWILSVLVGVGSMTGIQQSSKGMCEWLVLLHHWITLTRPDCIVSREEIRLPCCVHHGLRIVCGQFFRWFIC